MEKRIGEAWGEEGEEEPTCSSAMNMGFLIAVFEVAASPRIWLTNGTFRSADPTSATTSTRISQIAQGATKLVADEETVPAVADLPLMAYRMPEKQLVSAAQGFDDSAPLSAFFAAAAAAASCASPPASSSHPTNRQRLLCHQTDQ